MMSTENKDKSVVDSWLEEYSKESTKYYFQRNLKKFLEWANVSAEDLVKEYNATSDKKVWAKKWGLVVVKYYNDLIKQDKKINTARAMTTAVRAFFSSKCDTVKIKRGAIGKQQIAFGEHEFKQEQLQRMFRVANIKEKAILSLGVCLGYGATAFINLKREMLEKIIAQTEFEETPIGFWYQRAKTSQPIRSHLTTEAIQALQDYWQTLPEKSEWAFPNGSLKKHISDDALNYILKTLCEKANIQVMGQVRWHLLRKVLFSALTNVMDEMNAKLCVGKSISSDVLTYLKNKTEILKQQYGEAEKYFVLSGFTNHNHSKLSVLEQKVKLQDETLQKFLDVFTQYLEDKLTKKQATQQVRIISEPYVRILDEKEAYEEQLGRNLTNEEYQQIKQKQPRILTVKSLEERLGRSLTDKEIQQIKRKRKAKGLMTVEEMAKQLDETDNQT